MSSKLQPYSITKLLPVPIYQLDTLPSLSYSNLQLNMNIAFPEPTAVRPINRTNKDLRKLLAVLYLFAGVSGFLALASKFLIEPLFQQLTLDRQAYVTKAYSLLAALNAKVSSIVSVIPSVEFDDGNNNNKKKNCEAQTQTDDSVGVGSDLGSASATLLHTEEITAASKMNSTLNELALELSSDQLSSIETPFEDVSSYLNSLAFQSNNGALDHSAVSQLKKDIRAIKGTLLSI